MKVITQGKSRFWEGRQFTCPDCNVSFVLELKDWGYFMYRHKLNKECCISIHCTSCYSIIPLNLKQGVCDETNT